MAGRCVLYPPHSTLLLLPDGIVFTELVNSPGSGVMAGRCVLYPPDSTLLLLPDGIVFTELVNSPIVGKSSLARLGKVCPLSPHNEELDQQLDTESVAHTSFFATLPDPDGLLLFFAHSPRAGERILWHPLADINEA